MFPWILCLVFVIAEATLIYFCVSVKAPEIEAELSRMSLEALSARNVVLGDDFVMDGRDAWLIGPVGSDADKARAGLAVASVPGVRVVHNLLKTGANAALAAAPPVIPTAPAETAPVQGDASSVEIQRSIDGLIAGRVVEFESGSNRLTARGGALVDELAALLARHPDAKIEIAGHTDSQGTSRNNLELSRKRAEAVRGRLVSGGVQESRLTASGYGEERPIARNSTAAGRLRNRRVEFIVQ